MDTRQAVAERILQLCEERRLAVNELARTSAVPPSTLKNIINGGRKTQALLQLRNCATDWKFPLPTFLTPTRLEL